MFTSLTAKNLLFTVSQIVKSMNNPVLPPVEWFDKALSEGKVSSCSKWQTKLFMFFIDGPVPVENEGLPFKKSEMKLMHVVYLNSCVIGRFALEKRTRYTTLSNDISKWLQTAKPIRVFALKDRLACSEYLDSISSTEHVRVIKWAPETPEPKRFDSSSWCAMCSFLGIRDVKDIDTVSVKLKEMRDIVSVDPDLIAGAFCECCKTNIQIVGASEGPRMLCVECGSRAGMSICRLLDDQDLERLEKFIRKGFRVGVCVDGVENANIPFSYGGLRFEGKFTLSKAQLLDTCPSIGGDPHTIFRKRNRKAFYFAPESQCNLKAWVLNLRESEFLFAADRPFHGITTLEKSTIVLCGGIDSTAEWHIDRSYARNVGFLYDPEGRYETPIPPVIAIWCVVSPAAVSMADQWLRANGFRDGFFSKIIPTEEQALRLQADLGFAEIGRPHVVVVYQRAGDMVEVPVGWPHCVRNIVPNIKVAWDVPDPKYFPACIDTWRNIISPKKLPLLDDYTGMFSYIRKVALE